jgi:hypothetical protein
LWTALHNVRSAPGGELSHGDPNQRRNECGRKIFFVPHNRSEPGDYDSFESTGAGGSSCWR